jgi:DNA-binding response OmpR family regulator
MSVPPKKLSAVSVLIADANGYGRSIISETLRGAGIGNTFFARDGEDLVKLTAERGPTIVITDSRLPQGSLSGLEFTRLIRRGVGEVPRTLPIIVMTSTASIQFVAAARESGVDEMLVRPFNAAALLARIEAVLLRPRRFIDSVNYVGPCRRRRMLEDYGGTLRRFSDPLEQMGKAPWEAESNRELVRNCVSTLSQMSLNLTPGDRRKLREIFQAVQDTKQTAEDIKDESMAAAAASLGRYIQAIGASGDLDAEAISTHIDGMQKLSLLGSVNEAERKSLVEGLEAVVDKRLGRTPTITMEEHAA